MKKETGKTAFSAYEKLKEGIEKIISNGEYEKFLKMLKNFHHYSFYNQMLIYSQNPDATQVAGYVTWSKSGRGVKKHPTKIYIVRPIFKKKEEQIEGQRQVDDEFDSIFAGIKEKKKSKKTYEQIDNVSFTTACVYDIEDTYIKDKKKASILDEGCIVGESTQELFEVLKHLSPANIFVEHIYGTALGYCHKETNKIVLSDKLPLDQKTSVLLHELTHYLYDDFEYKEYRNLSEVFVESVAFIVADFFGLDTSKCSFKYITHWAEGDIKVILELGNKIQKTSKEFIDKISENLAPQERISA